MADASRSIVSRVVGIFLGIVLLAVLTQINGWIDSAKARSEHKRAMQQADEAIKKGKKLDASKVPDNLQDLVPLAEKWGWHDEDVRERVAEKATPNERLQLVTVMKTREKDIEDWVNSAAKGGFTDEMLAFVALCNAAGEVDERKK